MRWMILLVALVACDDGGTDTDTDTDTAADTDTDTDTAAVEPAIDLEGRWQVPLASTLPSQADQFWCVGVEVGDYNDETWLELGAPVECYEGTGSGCINDLEFNNDGTVTRHVRYSARGPCPYDGITRSVIAWESWGSWGFVSTDAGVDTYDVNGMTWEVRALGDGSSIVIEGDGQTVTLSPGPSSYFEEG